MTLRAAAAREACRQRPCEAAAEAGPKWAQTQVAIIYTRHLNSHLTTQCGHRPTESAHFLARRSQRTFFMLLPTEHIPEYRPREA